MPHAALARLLCLLLLSARAAGTVEDGAVALTALHPWQHIGRFSFAAGDGGIVDGAVTGVAPGSARSVYFYCEREWEKLATIRAPGTLPPAAECEAVTAPGAYLASAALAPNEDGVAQFALTLPHRDRETVCSVALADCSIGLVKGGDSDSMLGSISWKDTFLHASVSHQGIVPPIMGLGVFGLVPGLVSGFLSMAESEHVLAWSSSYMTAAFKQQLQWSPHGYTLHFENDGSHLPAEEAGMTTLHGVLTLGLLAFVPLYYRMVKNHQLVGNSRDVITIWYGLSSSASLMTMSLKSKRGAQGFGGAGVPDRQRGLRGDAPALRAVDRLRAAPLRLALPPRQLVRPVPAGRAPRAARLGVDSDRQVRKPTTLNCSPPPPTSGL